MRKSRSRGYDSEEVSILPTEGLQPPRVGRFFCLMFSNEACILPPGECRFYFVPTKKEVVCQWQAISNSTPPPGSSSARAPNSAWARWCANTAAPASSWSTAARAPSVPACSTGPRSRWRRPACPAGRWAVSCRILISTRSTKASASAGRMESTFFWQWAAAASSTPPRPSPTASLSRTRMSGSCMSTPARPRSACPWPASSPSRQRAARHPTAVSSPARTPTRNGPTTTTSAAPSSPSWTPS